MPSAVPAAKAALYAIVSAAVPAGVVATYGDPGSFEAPEAVWLGAVERFGDTPSQGQVSHRESFDVPIVVYVLRQDTDDEAADARAWGIAGAIEDAVRAAPDLNGATNVTAAWVAGKSGDSFSADDGVVAACVVYVTVRSKT
jgi:hypothetical protein